MKVLVKFSDPSAQKDAIAISVLGGSLSDPVDMPGLAHYLEHSVFLGSQKFPQENGYSRFLKVLIVYCKLESVMSSNMKM